LKDSADNPFLPRVHNLEELVGDQEGECETSEIDEGVAYDSDTENIWVSFATSCGLNSPEDLFTVIVYYALHTKFPIGKFRDHLAEVLKLMNHIEDHAYQRADVAFMKRAFHHNAPIQGTQQSRGNYYKRVEHHLGH